MSDDHTKAEALRLAKEYLDNTGWGYTLEEIGEAARKILEGLAKGKRDER